MNISTYKKRRGSIAAGHDKTAEAAALIFEAGGNAFDAAIAAFYASFVAEPCMSSAGGGGFANILDAKGNALFMDFFCQTPKFKRPLKDIEFDAAIVDFGETTEEFHVGMGSIGVPGSIAGIYEIYERYATLPMKELVAPALSYAREGVVMNDFQFFDIGILKPILIREQESRDIFYKEGRQIAVGEKLYLPGMADYLEFMVKEGRSEFYEGEFAKQLIRDSEERGLLRAKDLREYRVLIGKPLRFSYRDKTILTNPLPAVGGTIMGLVFRALSNLNINYSAGSILHRDQLSLIIQEVYKLNRELDVLNKKWGSTSHFNVADELGNAVSITVSNGEGSGYMVPGTNIMTNNMLGESSLLPKGLHSWDEDVRLSSMMSPTILLNGQGGFEAVLGSGGGSRIPSMIAQVLHYIIDFNYSVEQAVEAHRLHHEHGDLNLEPTFARLEGGDYPGVNTIRWKEESMFFGGVHAIRKEKGELIAVGDKRRDGFAVRVE